jgi:hypothetical protein
LSTLIIFGAFSPKANEIASKMLLLPDPLAPEMATRPGSKLTNVFLYPNDLNPKISSLRI